MLKDITGRAEELVELPEGSRVDGVFEHYAAQFPRLRDVKASVVFARNHQFSPGSTLLTEGDEIAFLPPVSGGSGAIFTQHITEDAGHFFALTRHPIDSASLSRQIVSGSDGAIVVFEGVVRDNTKGRSTQFLDYECYEAMAIQTIAAIGREIAGSYAIGRIAMVHRLGRMAIGEGSVVIVVTAPHRRPAFEASLEAIDRLKRLVPIWKKEYFADGEVWVEGEWDQSVLQSAPPR